MPLYDYQCDNGHTTEIFAGMNDDRPKVLRCETCGCGAHRVFSTPVVVDDFPEHFNVSIGEVVKNRAHLKRIQKERGLQDYEKPRHSPGFDLVTDRLRRGA